MVAYRKWSLAQKGATSPAPDWEDESMTSHTSLRPGVSRRVFMKAGAAALAMPAIATKGFAQETFECKIAHTEGIGTPITNAFEAWAQTLNERSEGRIDAQHFPATQQVAIEYPGAGQGRPFG
jgi:hypothetical protein